MAKDHEEIRARYHLFQATVLADQRSYYESAIKKNKRAAEGVNFVTALFTFIAGVTSAMVAVLGSQPNPDTDILSVLILISIIFPVIGASFSTLADLYQWKRLESIYDNSHRSLEEAIALTPDDEMPREVFKNTFYKYTEGALQVMQDETAQWGQLIKPSETLESFVARSEEIANQQSGKSSTDKS